jgi:heptosyltransferase-2
MEKTRLSSSTESKSDSVSQRAQSNGRLLPVLDGRTVTDLVWMQTSFIGDIVLTTAAMAAAQRVWPDVRQSVITTTVGATVFKGLPFVERVFLFVKRGGPWTSGICVTSGSLRAWRKLLPEGSRAVILQAHKSFRSSLVSRMTGLPVVTYRESSRLPFTGKFDVTLVDRVIPLHESARVGMLLEPFGMTRETIVSARPDLGLRTNSLADHKETAPTIDQVSSRGRRIALAPGSVWGTKRWLPDRFARLAVELLARVPDATIILTGSPDEASLCESIERKISNPARVDNLAGKTGLKDLAVLFSGFDLVVTNDSSPVHFASALNVPTVAIFGATIPQFGFAPLASHHHVVEAGSALACRPCSEHGPQVCPQIHFRCMKDISVERVLTACMQILQAAK